MPGGCRPAAPEKAPLLQPEIHRRNSSARDCWRRGIEALTLFAFSSENWRRPVAEVSSLMSLFVQALASEIAELHGNGVRLRFIGDRQALAAQLRERMAAAELDTSANSGLQLQIAVSYGGRSDIVLAARALAAACERGDLHSGSIDEARFAAALALAGLPEPDLFIRTGGEQRVSNFMLMQCAYSEMVFTPEAGKKTRNGARLGAVRT